MIDEKTDKVRWNKKDKNGKTQGYFPFNNLPTTLNDCIAMRKAGWKYGFKDYGPDDMYIQENDPTFNQWRKIKANISKRCMDNPEIGHIILSCFAGHGMIKDGKQIVLTNEFDKGFYKSI